MEFWNQPPGWALTEALDELRLEEDDLEEVEEISNVPVGKYATLDRVFALAHEITAEEEEQLV